ncbi:MAG: HD domain-containing protein [Candidatus Wildermuthbacteria bacterium]|nr:HD domain-containing protein [Candidatus Wildermuthbacteria bacterium]
MRNLIQFFLKIGEVKLKKQRGLVLRNIKDPATVGNHSFREALMAWVLAKAEHTGLDENRLIKLVLFHDLVAGYAGDITPYDPLLKKGRGKNLKKMYEKWVRLSSKEKKQFYAWQKKEEYKALKRLIANLPSSLKAELTALWDECKEGSSREGRFVQQLDMLENFFQAIEYWKKDKSFSIESWWQQMKELLNEPLLVQFLGQVDEYLYKPELPSSKK